MMCPRKSVGMCPRNIALRCLGSSVPQFRARLVSLCPWRNVRMFPSNTAKTSQVNPADQTLRNIARLSPRKNVKMFLRNPVSQYPRKNVIKNVKTFTGANSVHNNLSFHVHSNNKPLPI